MNLMKGIKLDLSDMKETEQKKLLKVMARISEASYRRGVQHGHEAIESVYAIAGKDLYKFRYGISLDRKFMNLTPVDRLFCEYWGSLNKMGLYSDLE